MIDLEDRAMQMVSSVSDLLKGGGAASLVTKLRVSTEHATRSLADVLPHAIDHMTPTGEPPAADAAPPDPIALTAKLFRG